jgi:two-component system invasion response regulator UvrY
VIRVLVVDDNAIVRAGLKQILADAPDMVVADGAGKWQEVLDKVSTSDFDVVVLDISLPGKNGIDILKEIKSRKPELPVLILSMHPEEQYAVRTLRAGAAGYLRKESAPSELISAIRKASSGGKYITPSLAERLATELEANHEKPPHELLSDREYEVLLLIASGKTVKQVAAEMSLSTKTISTYRSRILEKMKMENSAELTHYAIANGLVE